MILLFVNYSVKPGTAEKVKELAKPVMAATRQEKGNHIYRNFVSLENENDMFVLELWDNMECLGAHTSASHYTAFSEARKDMVVDGSYSLKAYEVEPITDMAAVNVKNDGKQKFFIVAEYSIKDEFQKELVNMAIPAQGLCQKENGNERYTIYQSIENKNDFVCVEIWESPAAIGAHGKAPHYIEFTNKRKDMLVEGSFSLKLFEGELKMEK